MENQQVLEIIAGLKGKKNYEEKKSKKLGYKSLYSYFEDKLAKAATVEKNTKPVLRKKVSKKVLVKKAASCDCC